MKVFEDFGRGTIGFFEYAGGIASLTAESGYYIGRLRISVAETTNQAYLLGVQSAPIVLLTSLFIGMVISFESAQNAANYGVSNLVGGAVAYTSARELGPMLSAVVVAGRAGAAIAAELGSMVVTEQVEALEALGLSPTRMLVVPRLVAMVLMMPVLAIMADIISITGGAFVAKALAGIPYDEFVQSARTRGLLPGAGHPRRRGRGRQSYDGRRRHRDHFDLHVELYPDHHFVRQMSFASIENCTLRFGEKIVLKNCSLEIKEHAITCLIGLSGAGKSTILRLLNGLRQPDEGRVIVKGIDIASLPNRDLVDFRRHIGFAFQFAALFDSLSVGDNVAMPLREHTRMSPSEIDKVVNATLESVGLENVRERFPSELSGGMLKRAGFARAVVNNPELVLYDEPTTGLDPIITHVLTDTIKRLRRQLNGTAVVVSHDLGSIYAMADYVAMLFEGAIIAYGTVEELQNSPNPIVQQFLQGSEVGPIPL
jgi:phospholipid/cholesterol/gamma-HCH transport system ATP-binding protein